MDALLRQRIHELLKHNSRTFDGFSYTVPSPTSYPYQWFWDSCFHAILWSHFDVPRAEAELRSLVARQHDSGLIGHISYWEPHHVLQVDWGVPGTSNLLQPPLLAYAVWRIYERNQDVSFLAELYPTCKRYYDYIIAERDVRGVGLYGLINPDESGEDTNPRFDADMELPHHHLVPDHLGKRFELFAVHRDCNLDARCSSETFWVEDVAFNTYLQWNLGIMSDIAHRLGRIKEANTFTKQASALKEAMRQHMLVNGVYRSVSGKTKEHATTDEWSQFVPMMAGLYTQSEAYQLVHKVLYDQERFWLPYGVPTVSALDPAFDPEEPTWGEAWQHPHWRGPIWISQLWFIHKGLRRYGFNEAAHQIREQALHLVRSAGFREYYHPHTGKGMGAESFSWGCLVIDMEHDHVNDVPSRLPIGDPAAIKFG